MEFDLEKSDKAQPLFKYVAMNIILVTLDIFAALKRHTVQEPIINQVIKGLNLFRIDDNMQNLTMDQLFILKKKRNC